MEQIAKLSALYDFEAVVPVSAQDGNGMDALVERYEGTDVPSRAFSDGGIHEAIMDYEDTVFYEILAEELARRDMDYQPVSNDNYEALVSRMDDYIAEFEAHGTDNISIPDMDLP